MIDSVKSELKLKRIKVKVINKLRRGKLVIAGASLIIIDEDQSLKEEFLEISDYIDVVLACRVSPK